MGTSHSCYLHPHSVSYTWSSVLVSGAVRSWSLAVEVLSNHLFPSCSKHHPLCQNDCYFTGWEKPTIIIAFYNLFTYIIFKHFYLYTGHVIIIDFIWAEIKSIIRFLKPKNSSGYDEISCKIIKSCASIISSPVSYIYNYSLHTGIFPDRLKTAVVKPMHKKGDKFNISNYRPISLLPTFSKIFEKAMYSRLNQHLYANNILVPKQYALRKGMSTEVAAFSLTDSILKSLNQKLHVGGIFYDLSKVFDCVNHEILLTKLHFYGIRGI